MDQLEYIAVLQAFGGESGIPSCSECRGVKPAAGHIHTDRVSVYLSVCMSIHIYIYNGLSDILINYRYRNMTIHIVS